MLTATRVTTRRTPVPAKNRPCAARPGRHESAIFRSVPSSIHHRAFPQTVQPRQTLHRRPGGVAAQQTPGAIRFLRRVAPHAAPKTPVDIGRGEHGAGDQRLTDAGPLRRRSPRSRSRQRAQSGPFPARARSRAGPSPPDSHRSRRPPRPPTRSPAATTRSADRNARGARRCSGSGSAMRSSGHGPAIPPPPARFRDKIIRPRPKALEPGGIVVQRRDQPEGDAPERRITAQQPTNRRAVQVRLHPSRKIRSGCSARANLQASAPLDTECRS